MHNISLPNLLFRTLTSICIIFFFFSIEFILAQDVNDYIKPTPDALKKATQYWKVRMENLAKNDEIAEYEIKRLTETINNEAKNTRKILPIKDYVQIFTLNWDENKVSDIDSFNKSYNRYRYESKSLTKYKSKIEKNFEHEIRKILQQRNSDSQEKQKNEENSKKYSYFKNFDGLTWGIIGVTFVSLLFSFFVFYMGVTRWRVQKETKTPLKEVEEPPKKEIKKTLNIENASIQQLKKQIEACDKKIQEIKQSIKKNINRTL